MMGAGQSARPPLRSPTKASPGPKSAAASPSIVPSASSAAPSPLQSSNKPDANLTISTPSHFKFNPKETESLTPAQCDAAKKGHDIKYMYSQPFATGKQDAVRRRVLIMCLGGTLVMQKNEQGSLTPKRGYLEQFLSTLYELEAEGMPEVVMDDSITDLIDSSDMDRTHWVKIVTCIEANYLDFDGFVVIMGTDTMAYAASAVSFMLENLSKPVVFTGSTIPICEVFSDARKHIIMSLIMASSHELNEVCVFFNNQLLRGNRTIKSESMGLNAFTSPNFPPLARMELGVHLRRDLILPNPKFKFKAHKHMAENIICMRLIPGFDDVALEAVIDHAVGLKALVLEIFGTGNMPSQKPRLLRCLEKAQAKGIVVCATSQCYTGAVKFDLYAVGQGLIEKGVIPAGDMTIMAVTTKLAYLLGRGLSLEEVRVAMPLCIRGELSQNTVGTAVVQDYLDAPRKFDPSEMRI